MSNPKMIKLSDWHGRDREIQIVRWTPGDPKQFSKRNTYHPGHASVERLNHVIMSDGRVAAELDDDSLNVSVYFHAQPFQEEQ